MNTNIFKRAAVILSISLLAACGGGTPAASNNNTPPPSATTGIVTYYTARVADLPIDLSFDGSPTISGSITAASTKVGAVTSAPLCGSNSATTFSKVLTIGVHNKNVVSRFTGLVWTPTVTVNLGCTLIELI